MSEEKDTHEYNSPFTVDVKHSDIPSPQKGDDQQVSSVVAMILGTHGVSAMSISRCDVGARRDTRTRTCVEGSGMDLRGTQPQVRSCRYVLTMILAFTTYGSIDCSIPINEYARSAVSSRSDILCTMTLLVSALARKSVRQRMPKSCMRQTMHEHASVHANPAEERSWVRLHLHGMCRAWIVRCSQVGERWTRNPRDAYQSFHPYLEIV